jgi:hypothetical protein
MFAAFATMTSNGKRSLGPQIDQGVDVSGKRIRFRRDVQHVMEHHVRVERSHEQQGRRLGIEGADPPGVHGPAEVVADDGQPAARRTVGRVRVERDDQTPLGAGVHVDGDVLRHETLGEGDELLGHLAQHLARIGVDGVHTGQCQDYGRGSGESSLHGGLKEGLLRLEVPEDGCRRDADDFGDIGERRAVEAPLAEDAAGGLEQIVTGDARWTAHL